jgi:hypothetical protein
MTGTWEGRLGNIKVTPEGPVTAGSMMEWTLVYTVGSYGVDEGGTFMLVQRLACDMERPQFDRPSDSGYSVLTTTGNCRLNCRFQPKSHPRPWMRWCLVIDVLDGFLTPGDKVNLVLGDRSQGSPGIRSQTFQEKKHEFRWLVDPTNAANPMRLSSSPTFPILAGNPVRLECLLPSQLSVGETARIFVKGEDYWGNPTLAPEDLQFTLSSTNSVRVNGELLLARSPGVVWVEASAGGMTCHSNPLKIVETSTEMRPYWADLHGQTDNTVGTGSVEEYFDFAHRWARLDIVGHQGNDFQVTDEDWDRLNDIIKHHNQPGRMVVLPGYEWSGNTSAGGDHNIFFKEDDPPILRSSHWQIPEVPESDLSPAHPLDVLFEKLKALDNFNSIVIPHVGGRYGDVRRYFDPGLEPLVEILSCHGVFEWILWDALEAGHRVGVVCNSDGHKGRPGAEGPGAGHFGIKGGLTCVLAAELNREEVFDALQNRRCYGTTGCRMLLGFEANGCQMGAELTTDQPITLQAFVHGTAPVESLSVFKGSDEIRKVRSPEFDNMENSQLLYVFWEGARIRGRARRATWDGEIQIEGTKIVAANTVAFDSPADGIVEASSKVVHFHSSTVGDRDGIELRLEQAREGRLSFVSPIGRFSVRLEELGNAEQCFSFGGLGLKAGIRRQPEQLNTRSLALEHLVSPTTASAPFLVKAVQTDGHMAWSSPIFISKDRA